MNSLTIPESAILVGALNPAADAAGRTGNYVDMKRAHRLLFVFYIKQGNAATIALSLSKVTAISGAAGATATTAAHRIWSNEAGATTSVLTAQTAATSFTTSAALADKIVVMEVDPGSEGATFIAVAPVTGASNAANITSCLCYVIPKVQSASNANAMVD